MTSEFKPSLNEEEKAFARALLLALEPFRNIRSTMPLQYVYTFLLVATEEGRGVTEYAHKAGVSLTVMTRHLLDIGDRNRQREEGFGLVVQERDRHDLRRHNARITPEGKALMHKIITALKTACKESTETIHDR
jgi:DNA-binding MarR family transcriptional regulator